MKKVDELPQSTGYKYPWHELFDGSIWLIDPVEEFGATSVEAFRAGAYDRAAKQDMTVHVLERDDGVYVQAVPKRRWLKDVVAEENTDDSD